MKALVKSQLGMEVGVEAEVLAKTRPVIGIDKVRIIPMDDGHVPAH